MKVVMLSNSSSTPDLLAQFCRLFSIPKANCTCSDADIFKSGICGVSTTQTTEFIYTGGVSKAYGLIALTTSIIALIGNSLVLGIAWKNKHAYVTCQKLIALLAICDLVFAVIQLILAIPVLWTDQWVYGEVMCKILKGSTTLGGILAIGFISIISIERFIGVVRPIFDSNTFVAGLSVTNLIVGSLSVIPLMVYLEVDSNSICLMNWPSRTVSIGYLSYLFFGTCVLPVLLIGYLYCVIIYKLKKGLKEEVLQRAMGRELYEKRTNESRRVIRIVLGLVIAFVIFVFPSRIIELYLTINQEYVSDKTYKAISLVALTTYPFHVAINPFLYSVIDVRWRKELRRIFQLSKPKKYSSSEQILGSPQSGIRRKSKRGDTTVTIRTMDDTVV